MKHEEKKEESFLQEEAAMLNEILESCVAGDYRPGVFTEEMDKSVKILRILQTDSWAKTVSLSNDEDLLEWLEKTSEEAGDSVVSFYPTTHGLSTDIDGHEVEDISWWEVQDVDRLVWKLWIKIDRAEPGKKEEKNEN